MMKSFGIKAKLMGTFLTIVLLIIILVGVSFVSTERILHYYSHVAKVNLGNLIALSTTRTSIKDMAFVTSTLIGSELPADQVAAKEKTFNEAMEKCLKGQKEYLDIPFFSAEEEAIWQKAFEHWQPYVDLSRKIMELSKSSDKSDLAKRDSIGQTEWSKERAAMIDGITAAVEYQKKEVKKWEEDAQSAATAAKTVIFFVAIFTIFFALTLGMAIVSQLSKSLRDTVDHLTHSSSRVTSEADKLQSTSKDSAEAVQKQAACLQQVSAAITQVNSMIEKNTESAKVTADATIESQTQVQEGRNVATELVQSMSEINASNQKIVEHSSQTNQRLQEIIQVIREIDDKTKVINDIVFQTKLLSFNASVEAARAGEHGKGFAVVAEEVGNLAQSSGNAAKEISSMLEGSIKKVELIAQETESQVNVIASESRTKVDAGSSIATRCRKVFEDVYQNVSKSAQMAKEISTASEEQSRGVAEITTSVDELNKMTQHNSANSAELAESAKDLSSQAEVMNSAVSSLIQVVNGAGAGQPALQATWVAKKPAVSIKPPAQKVAKIVPIKKVEVSRSEMKKASGSSVDIPQANDDRFEDI